MSHVDLGALLNSSSVNIDSVSDVYVYRHHKVPRSLERSVKHWLQYRFRNQRADEARKAIIKDLPEELRLALAVSLDSELFSQVRFIAQLVIRMNNAVYRANSPIATADTPADKIVIITSGRVRMTLRSLNPAERMLRWPTQRRPKALYVLREGDSFGACSILGDQRWAGDHGIDADFVSEEDCSVTYIYTKEILELLDRTEFRDIRAQIEALSFKGGVSSGQVSRSSREPAPVAVFHWIRVARAAICSLSTNRWTTAISRVQENLASQKLLVKAVKGAAKLEETREHPWLTSEESARSVLNPQPPVRRSHKNGPRPAIRVRRASLSMEHR